MTETQVAYIECLPAQEAAYWEARRQEMGLSDKQIGDLLRAAAPHLLHDALAEIGQYANEPRWTENERLKAIKTAVKRVTAGG